MFKAPDDIDLSQYLHHLSIPSFYLLRYVVGSVLSFGMIEETTHIKTPFRALTKKPQTLFIHFVARATWFMPYIFKKKYYKLNIGIDLIFVTEY